MKLTVKQVFLSLLAASVAYGTVTPPLLTYGCLALLVTAVSSYNLVKCSLGTVYAKPTMVALAAVALAGASLRVTSQPDIGLVLFGLAFSTVVALGFGYKAPPVGFAAA